MIEKKDDAIYIRVSDDERKKIRKKMSQCGITNESAYIRKMAIDGFQIKADFSEIHELARLMSIDSRNINQIAKAANTYGWVDEKIIADMKAEHEKVLKTVKDKDEWSSLANFIGNIIAKYADEIDFDSLPDPDVYLQKRYI